MAFMLITKMSSIEDMQSVGSAMRKAAAYVPTGVPNPTMMPHYAVIKLPMHAPPPQYFNWHTSELKNALVVQHDAALDAASP